MIFLENHFMAPIPKRFELGSFNFDRIIPRLKYSFKKLKITALLSLGLAKLLIKNW